MTLTEFLLARIAEDEAAARGATKLYRAIGEHENVYGDWVPIIPVGGDDRAKVEQTADFYRERGARNVEVVVFYDPARVLADCEAKRRIVEWAAPVLENWPGAPEGFRYVSDDGMDVLRLLALPYADHPDYQEEWQPEPSRSTS